MPFSNKGFDPETIAFLEECLAISMEVASRIIGGPVSDETKQRLAMAIMEGAELHYGNKDALVDYALASLPQFRTGLAN